MDDNFICQVNGVICPSYVNPMFLHEANGQHGCFSENRFCSIQCTSDNNVFWYAHECHANTICPPHGTIHWSHFYTQNPFLSTSNTVDDEIENPFDDGEYYFINVPPHLDEPLLPHEMQFTEYEIQFMLEKRQNYDYETKSYLQKYGYDLRGLRCEILNNKEVCYAEHRGGRFVSFF